MNTFVYMVRHGDSPKMEGNERTRELTSKGKSDAHRITDRLEREGIEVFVSSPYKRSILTIQELAEHSGQKIVVFEDLKERVFSTGGKRLSNEELSCLLKKSFSNPHFVLAGGESNADCQNRAINVLRELLKTYRGQKIVLGTHGVVMTLMMNYYNSQYNLNFLLHTSKPDIYRMEFNSQKLVDVKRLWDVSA